jgi:hypothetical protein
LADIEDGIWQTYGDDGVLLFGVNNESEQILTDFVGQVGITFPVLRGEPQGYTLLGGLSPFPRDFIIDPDGVHDVHWDGTDDRGLPLPSGVYVYRLEAGDDAAVRRMLLAR